MVNVTLIGTAGAVPLPERALSSCFITLDGRSILFDCGEGTQTAAKKQGINLMRTDVIALTHYHGDHIFGIPGLLQSMNLGERTRPIYIVGPVREGGSIFQELAPILALTGRLNYEVVPLAMPEDGLDLSRLIPEWTPLARLESFYTEHKVTSCGYSFLLKRRGKFLPENALALGIPRQLWRPLQNGNEVFYTGDDGQVKTAVPSDVMGPERKGIKISFTGDTRVCDALEEAAYGADLLICDGTYGSDDNAETAFEYCHMTFSQAGRIAAGANVKRLWLTHFSQRMRDPEEFLEYAAAEFPEAECGFDGKSADIDFD